MKTQKRKLDTTKNKKDSLTLIVLLKKQINYLSYKHHIPGLGRDDLRQELILKIIVDFKNYGIKSLGWWFIRLQWYIRNMFKKSKLQPLNNTISIHKYYE